MIKYIIVALYTREIKDMGHIIVPKPLNDKKYSSRNMAERYVPREAPLDNGFIGFRIDEIFLTAKDELKLLYPEAKIKWTNGAIKKCRVYDNASSSNLSNLCYTELEAWEYALKTHGKGNK